MPWTSRSFHILYLLLFTTPFFPFLVFDPKGRCAFQEKWSGNWWRFCNEAGFKRSGCSVVPPTGLDPNRPNNPRGISKDQAYHFLSRDCLWSFSICRTSLARWLGEDDLRQNLGKDRDRDEPPSGASESTPPPPSSSRKKMAEIGTCTNPTKNQY